jgi:hypothetical protein
MPAFQSDAVWMTRGGMLLAPVAPFWIWMQLVIVICVLISAVIAIVKLV